MAGRRTIVAVASVLLAAGGLLALSGRAAGRTLDR